MMQYNRDRQTDRQAERQRQKGKERELVGVFSYAESTTTVLYISGRIEAETNTAENSLYRFNSLGICLLAQQDRKQQTGQSVSRIGEEEAAKRQL